MGEPQNGWFIRESPSIDGWFSGSPIYGPPPYLYIQYSSWKWCIPFLHVFSDIPLLSLGSGMIFDLLIRWLNMMKHQASQFSSVIASHPWRSVKAVCQAFGPSDTRRTEKFSCLKCLDSGKMASLPPFGGKTWCFFSSLVPQRCWR